MNLADSLNLACACQTLEPGRLREQLEHSPALAGLTAQLATSHPHLFASTAVFLDQRTCAAIGQAVASIERAIALPAYQDHTLAQSPAIAQQAFGPTGVFMGCDFHIDADGPRLIEINTNAGGALLNAALARAHRACCATMDAKFASGPDARASDETFMDMFRNEWQLQRGGAPLRSVLIVDDQPEAQFLAPEFALARELFRAHGLRAEVADASTLVWRDGALWHPALPAGTPVDMVYNRLTDFDLSEARHAALRQAYLGKAVVLTPHPRAHALFADKRNLITLSNDALLARWGLSAADRQRLHRVVPNTQAVTPDRADALWAQRRGLFFKPARGYGAKAAYRGDKLTRGVWQHILADGGFVAQALVPPSERLVLVGDELKRLKLDIRAYTYQGHIQLLAARLYAGQATNMRTDSGGFSPVIVLPALPDTLPEPCLTP